MNSGSHIPRRLVAILYADVAGYSRLTGQDEDDTHRRLSEYLDLIAATIEGHRGRVMHYAGDAVLAMFEAVVDSLACAVAIQTELAARNADLPDDRKLHFRIGVNTGDVIEDRGDIYGDGVNVAARLETLAEPGGVCVSAAVRMAAGAHLPLDFEPLGKLRVKNIVQPLRPFHVRPRGVAWPRSAEAGAGPGGRTRRRRAAAIVALVAVPLLLAASVLGWRAFVTPRADVASVEQMALPLPVKPSIAVLPFDNLSGDPNQAYLADGMTEDIITSLSQVDRLFVIARNSSFVYKNQPVKIQDVAEALGVRYVLEGSVQKAGGRLRITAQLIDALTGHHLWSERYDREESNLFVLQDEIAGHIAVALQVKLTEGEQLLVWRRHSPDLDAWRQVAKGMDLFHRFNRAANAQAREAFTRAIELDRNYALAHVVLAWTYWLDAQRGWQDPEASFHRASLLAWEALALDDTLPDVHALMGGIHLYEGDFGKALSAAGKAVELNPNHATNTALLGMIQHHAGRAEESIRSLQRAMRLSPYHPAWFLAELAEAYGKAGREQDALDKWREYLARAPDPSPTARAHLHIALILDGRTKTEQAREEVARALEIDSSISIARFVNWRLDRDRAHKAVEALRRLGVPD